MSTACLFVSSYLSGTLPVCIHFINGPSEKPKSYSLQNCTIGVLLHKLQVSNYCDSFVSTAKQLALPSHHYQEVRIDQINIFVSRHATNQILCSVL